MESLLPPGVDAFRGELVPLARALIWDPGDLLAALETVFSQARSARLGSLTEVELRKWLLRALVLAVHAINRKRRPNRPAAPESEVDLFNELRLEESYRHLLNKPEQKIFELGQPLRNALIQLSELDRAVFLLRSSCDLKYQEISDAIDIPVGTVMGSLVRSRIKLRKALAEQIHEV